MKKIFFTALFFVFLFVAMAFLPRSSYPVRSASGITQSGISEFNEMIAAFPLAFGGRVLLVEPCTCTAGFRLTVGPPRPAYVLYQPGVSVLFSFFNFLPPNYVLGTYTPSGACFVGIPPACTVLPTFGTVVLMGTSLTPI